MPKTKKKWIDKKTAETFSFAGLKQREEASTEEGKSGQKPLNQQKIDEQEKYGVFYKDDYDYMQHLRCVNELNVLGGDDRTIVRAPKTVIQTSTFLETGGIEVNMEPVEAGSSDLPTLDEDVVAALEGDADYLEEIENDFICKLNGGELPSNQPPEPANTMLPPLVHRSRMDSYEALDMDHQHSMASLNSDGSIDENGNQDGEGVIHSKRARGSSSGRMIDEQFDHLYDDDFCDDEDEDEPTDMIEPDSHRMRVLLEESKNDEYFCLYTKNEAILRYSRASDSDEDDSSSSESDSEAVECPVGKRTKWDCESVLSSYSKVYNHPTVIKDETKERMKKKTLAHIESAIAEEGAKNVADLMDYDTTMVDRVPGTCKRRRGETAEERRERKQAVRQARAERRVEKKANKMAFKEARLSAVVLPTNPPTLKHIHIS